MAVRIGTAVLSWSVRAPRQPLPRVCWNAASYAASPAPALCLSCHKKEDYAKKKFVHGPVTLGACLVCHPRGMCDACHQQRGVKP